jgi:CBS domain-containing protein
MLFDKIVTLDEKMGTLIKSNMNLRDKLMKSINRDAASKQNETTRASDLEAARHLVMTYMPRARNDLGMISAKDLRKKLKDNIKQCKKKMRTRRNSGEVASKIKGLEQAMSLLESD